MKFQDDISNMNTYTHTYIHTYGQAETNMSPLFQSWGHNYSHMQNREAWWPSGRASDSRATGRGFDPHSGRLVVSFSKIHLPPKKVLVIPWKRWLHPDMTEKLLTGT